MIVRVAPALAALAAILVAAGCGGSGSASGTTVATTTGVAAGSATVTATATATTPAMQPACRPLTAAAHRTVNQLGSTLGGFRGITSLGGLARHTTALQAQLKSSAGRIAAVRTPPGALTRDKQRLSSALHAMGAKLAAAHRAAASGNVAAATKDFASLARLTALRSAAASLARTCTPH